MRILLPLIAAALLLTSCGARHITLSAPEGKATVQVAVEIADNGAEREQGLMQRTTLAENTGMLFVFTQPQVLQFWMKNTLIPLDILYFDADGRFTSGTDAMQPCKKDPCALYSSIEPSQYALEVPKGFRVKNGIGVGWTLNVNEVKGMSTPQ